MAQRSSAAPAHVRPADEPPLSDEEIEAILASEAASLPPHDAPAAEPKVAMHEPGRGRWGKVLVWLMVGFILMSAYHLYR